MKYILNKTLAILTVAFVIVFTTSCGGEQKPLMKYHMGETTESGDTIFYTIPEYEFGNQSGDKVTNETYKGKIHVVNFFFTSCPGICPVIMTELMRVQEAFQETDNVMLLSHTLDPKNDTPETMLNYGERRGVNFKVWNLVTGEPEAIHVMSREGYKMAAAWDNKAPGGINHTQRVTLVDVNGNIRGWYDGTDSDEVDRLIDDIEYLMTGNE